MSVDGDQDMIQFKNSKILDPHYVTLDYLEKKKGTHEMLSFETQKIKWLE